MTQNEPKAQHKPAERHYESDPKAFDELFREMYPRLVRFAFKITQDWNTSCDITQDVFVILWQRRDTIDPDRSVRAYLYRSVRNRAYNYQRDRREIADPESVKTMMDDSITVDSSLQDDGQQNAVLHRMMYKWIRSLPEKQRDAFEMSRFEGLYHAEIASVMGVSVKTVNNHLTAALKNLKVQYEEFRNTSQEQE